MAQKEPEAGQRLPKEGVEDGHEGLRLIEEQTPRAAVGAVGEDIRRHLQREHMIVRTTPVHEPAVFGATHLLRDRPERVVEATCEDLGVAIA